MITPSTADLATTAAQILAELRALRRLVESTRPEPQAVVAAAEKPVDSTVRANDHAGISALLDAIGVTMLGVAKPTSADHALRRVATMMLEHHAAIRPLLRALRWSATSGRLGNLTLADAPATDIGTITTVGSRLSELGLLARFSYSRGSRRVEASVATAGRAFITGTWLEYASEAVATAELGAIGHVARNALVRLPGGRDAELDVLAAVRDDLVWIECRSARASEQVGRYAALRRTLGVPPERAIIVVGELDDPSLAEDLGALHGLTFLPPSALRAYLRDLRESHPARVIDCAPSIEAPAPPISDSAERGQATAAVTRAEVTRSIVDPRDVNDIVLALTSAEMPPWSRERPAIVAALAAAGDEQFDAPRDVGELAASLASTLGLPPHIPEDILRALTSAGMLLGNDGKPIQHDAERVSAIATADPHALDAACCRVMRDTLAATAPWLLSSSGAEAALSAAIQPVSEVGLLS